MSRGKSGAEPAGLSLLNLNAAGIDVGATSHFVAVPADRTEQPVREFEAFTADLYRLAEWIAECGVGTVVMESTGVYWIPLFGVLEERGFQVMLVDYIKTGEDARGLLRAATDEDLGDGAVIRAAVKRVARTQNISALTRDTGLNRGNIYEALSEDGNPTLATLLKVANALGVEAAP